jgi:subtilisin family serine protease
MKLSYAATFKRMTTFFFFLSFTLLSAQASTPAPKFEGYIVKLKKGHHFFKNNSFLGTGGVTDLEVSFGDFYHINPAHSFMPFDLESLKNNPDVEYIEPNYLYSSQDDDSSFSGVIQSGPTGSEDPNFHSQWGLFNDGKNTWIKDSPAGIDVNALKGWEVSHKGRQDVVVAIIDSGMDYNHADLQKNLWINTAEQNGLPGVDDDNNGFIDDIHGYDFANNDGDPMDGWGHGTHISGIIGATHNNGVGIKGVMPHVKMMALKFLNDTGKGDTMNAVKAIDYAMKNGAQIISNSWGGGEYSQTLYDAILACADKNIIFTAAAGNINNDNDATPKYPASYKAPNLISVGAINALNQKASFSSFGKNSVNLFAPGVYIVSTDIKYNYQWRSGTSMATPIVSGALGLLLSMEPGMSAAEAKKRIMQTSLKTPDLLKYAQAGRLDIYRLLTNQRD